MQEKSMLNTFTDNNENTMNAYTVSSTLPAYQILYNQYNIQMGMADDFNGLFKQTIEAFFLLFKTHAPLPENSPITSDAIYHRAFKHDRLDAFAKQMPLEKVLFLVLTAVMDEKIEWVDNSTLKDRIQKLQSAFEETLDEGNCDTGVRNKLFSVLHNSYPGIFILGEINSELTASAVNYYQKKLEQMAPKEALTLIGALLRYEAKMESKEEHWLIQEWYQPEALKQHLTDFIHTILKEKRYKELSKGDNGIEKMIQDRVNCILQLPLPIASGKEQAIAGLKTLIQNERTWPLLVKQHFDGCKTLEEISHNLPCRVFLACQQLTRDITPYIHPQYLAIGETEKNIVEFSCLIEKKIRSLETLLTQNNDDLTLLEKDFNALEELEKSLLAEIEIRAKEKDVFLGDCLGTFFSIEQKKQKIQFFQKIITWFSAKKLAATDSLLNQWEQQTDKENNVSVARYLTVEQVNRLFLTAITQMPSDWSEGFTRCLEEVVELLKNLSPHEIVSYSLKQSSYPPELLLEMQWLIDIRKTKITEPLPDLTFQLPLPCNIGLPAEEKQEQFKAFYPLYPEVILTEPMWLHKTDVSAVMTAGDLIACLRHAAPHTEKLLEKLNRLISWTIIANVYDLRAMLRTLPKESRLSFIKDTLDLEFVKSILKNRYDLTCILEALPEASRLSFIKDTLDLEYVKSILKDKYDLTFVLKTLPEESRLSFIKDTLDLEYVKSILKDKYDLTWILEALPEASRLSFIKDTLDLEYVKSILKDKYDLTSVLKTLPKESRLSFIKDTLGLEFVKSIMTDGSSLASVLKTLPENTWSLFIKDTLGLEYVKFILKNEYYIASCLETLPENTRLSFIKDTLGLEFVKSIMTNGSRLASVLNTLHEESRLAFIKDTLGLEFVKSIMTNGSSLASVLKTQPEESRLAFIKDTLGLEYVKSIITNGDDLAAILEILPENTKLSFIKDTLGLEYINSIITNGYNLASVLKTLPEETWTSFIKDTLDLEYVKSIITNRYDLAFILKKLPEKTWASLIKDTLGLEFIKSILKNGYALVTILEILPENTRLSFIKDTLGLEYVKSIITDRYHLVSVLKTLPEHTRKSFIINTFNIPQLDNIDHLAPLEHPKVPRSLTVSALNRAAISLGIMALVFVVIAAAAFIPVVGPFLAGLVVTTAKFVGFKALSTALATATTAMPFIIAGIGAGITAGVLLVANLVVAVRAWIKNGSSKSKSDLHFDQSQKKTQDLTCFVPHKNPYTNKIIFPEHNTGNNQSRQSTIESNTIVIKESAYPNTSQEKQAQQKNFSPKIF